MKLEASKKERINMDTVKRATGCDITARQLEKGKKEYDVRDYGWVWVGKWFEFEW